VGGLWSVSRIAFSSSCIFSVGNIDMEGIDLDGDFHGDDLAFGDVFLDHCSVGRSRPLLLCSKKVSSFIR
jgi:hypothetical protein